MITYIERANHSHFVSSSGQVRMTHRDGVALCLDALRAGLEQCLFHMKAENYNLETKLIPCFLQDGFEQPRCVHSLDQNYDLLTSFLRTHPKPSPEHLMKGLQTLDKEHLYQLSKCAAQQFREVWAQLEARKIKEMLRHVGKLNTRSRGSWSEHMSGLKYMFQHSKQRRLKIQVPKHFHTHGTNDEDDEASDDRSESEESSSMHAYPASIPPSPETPPPKADHVTPRTSKSIPEATPTKKTKEHP